MFEAGMRRCRLDCSEKIKRIDARRFIENHHGVTRMIRNTAIDKVEVRRPGIPYARYFDECVHAFEQEHIFSKQPHYIGHELMVPNRGDYYVSQAANGRYVLVHNEEGIEVFQNICPHGKLTLMEGHGNVKKIVCPGHHWAFKRTGQLCAAPGFDQLPCVALQKIPVRRWNGMLFETDCDVATQLAGLDAFEELSFEGYELDSVAIDEHSFNWKIFLEICLENYHLKAVHPGLNHLVDAKTLQWFFGQDYAVQTLAPYLDFQQPATPIYSAYQSQIRGLYGAHLPRYCGVWAYLYPDINLEWYPFSLIISRVIPISATRIINVTESYYHQDIKAKAPEYIATEQAARDETGLEDEVMCLRMHEARQQAYDASTAPTQEIYHRFLESGRLWFHDRLCADMGGYSNTGELTRDAPTAQMLTTSI